MTAPRSPAHLDDPFAPLPAPGSAKGRGRTKRRAAGANAPPESAIQRATVGLLFLHGYTVVIHRQGALRSADRRLFVPMGARMRTTEQIPRDVGGDEAGTSGEMVGYPDLEVLLRGGHVIWLETKRPGETTSPAQRVWHAVARKLGHRVEVYYAPEEALKFVKTYETELASVGRR